MDRNREKAEVFLSRMEEMVRRHRSLIDQGVGGPDTPLTILHDLIKERRDVGGLTAYGLVFAGFGLLHYYDSYLSETAMQEEFRPVLARLSKDVDQLVKEILGQTRPGEGGLQ
jgi:hypothetical protein